MTEDELLTEVLTSPDELGARLVYADWLMSRGDLRGEFIATQCQLEGLLEDSRRQALRERELWLLEECGEEWLEALGLQIGEARFEGGLVEGLRVNSDRLLQIAARLSTCAPLRSVELVGSIPEMGAVLRQLARFPHLSSLKLVVMDLGAQDADMLASWPQLARLTSLEVLGNSSGKGVVERLVSSPSLAGLTSLALVSDELDVTDAHAIAVSRHLVGLTSLDLARNLIGDAGVLLLASTPHLARLGSLGLVSNEISDAGARALAASPFLSRLTSLSILRENDIVAGGLQALLARFGSGVVR
jgi:uncharacterized protein (TIGR02996 family)